MGECGLQCKALWVVDSRKTLNKCSPLPIFPVPKFPKPWSVYLRSLILQPRGLKWTTAFQVPNTTGHTEVPCSPRYGSKRLQHHGKRMHRILGGWFYCCGLSVQSTQGNSPTNHSSCLRHTVFRLTQMMARGVASGVWMQYRLLQGVPVILSIAFKWLIRTSQWLDLGAATCSEKSRTVGRIFNSGSLSDLICLIAPSSVCKAYWK